jgi:hypothetical protein
VLEFVHRDAIGQKLDGLRQMGIAVFVGDVEEKIHVGLGEELHRHGVDLAALHRRGAVFRNLDVAGEVGLEAVPKLMGEDIHVAGGPIEIGEDDRAFVNREIRHVAAALLAGFRVEEEQMVIHHEVEEIIRVRGKPLVHFLGVLDFFVGGAEGDRIAALEHEAQIIELRALDAGALGLLAYQLIGQRGPYSTPAVSRRMPLEVI